MVNRMKNKLKIKNQYKINFKKISNNDLKQIKDWRNLNKIREFTYQYTLLNTKTQNAWYSSLKKSDEKIMFLILNESHPIGTCGFVHYDKLNKSADVSIFIGDKNFHGKGIGTIILQKLIKYGFIKLNLHRIGAEIFEYNLISIKLFEKASFKKEATLRQSLWRHNKWWNVYVYSIINPGFTHNL